MECIRWLTWFIEFSLSGQQRKLFKLKNLREFVRVVLHIPLLKEEEEEPQVVRGGLVKPKVRPSLLECLLSRPLAFWTVDAVQHVWGRDLERVCSWWFGEISPTLILVPGFIQKENESGDKGLCRFWTPGSLNFIGSKNKLFILFCSLLFCSVLFIYFYCFIHGKLIMTGN